MGGRIALIVVSTLLAITLLVGGIWAFRYFTAETRGRITAEEELESSSSRITRYEHYYDLCASVQSHEAELNAQYSLLEQVESADERSRVRTNIAGIQSQRMRSINQYNADARKAYTSARFLGDDLPRELDTESYEQGDGGTVCER